VRVLARKGLICACLAAWIAAVPINWSTPAAQAPPAAQVQAPTPSPVTANRAVFERYCLTCHTTRQKERGTVPIALDTLDVSRVAADAAVWEKVVLKLRAGVMPPAGAPRPEKATHDGLAAWLEGELDRSWNASPDPGRTEPFHRLNRVEYRNAVRDLLGLDLDVSSLLPGDDVSYGFDNIAGVLKLSPTLMERYLSAAQKVSRLAAGTPPRAPSIDYYRIADDLSQDAHLPGLPLGTRGGTRISYVFPMDAVYEFRPRLTRDLNESMPLYTDPQVLEISIDGQRVGTFTLPGIGAREGRGAAPPAEPPDDPRAEPPVSPQPSPGQEPARPAISQIAQTVRASAKERQSRNRADESWNLRVPVQAGQRDVVITFLNRTSALDEAARLPFHRPYPAGVNIPETRLGAYLRSVEIVGPIDATGPGQSDSRRRIFTCSTRDEACARNILSTLARRAYRRPITAADVDPLMTFYREGSAFATATADKSTAADATADKSQRFDQGIERALRRLLVSPEFLFRVERDPANATAGRAYRVSDIELASRLSFFLWSSIPDDTLLDLAERGQLSSPAVLPREVRRMLADPRADAFITNFAGQWLFLRNLDATVPVQSIFPDFDDGLRQSFRRETELFFDSIVREDHSAFDLLRADYTFLNERLAKHYGVPNVKGSHFRRVALDKNSMRSGLLGQGAILTVTSYPDRTSPVVRGKWILENLLGTPPPPPLPNVPPLKPTNNEGAVLSMRQRMEQHRANPVCASCHAMMDPLGLSLENFDAVGKWRTLGESSAAIDARGRAPDGTVFEGPGGLRDMLLHSHRFVPTLTEKMLTYALGRGLDYSDAPAVRAIVRDAAKNDYRFSSLIVGIVQSPPFRMRRSE
jgi:mono/diheme cytochrome c family protein